MQIKEASKKWNISERRIRKLIQDGRIDGAKKMGMSWEIPDDTDDSSLSSIIWYESGYSRSQITSITFMDEIPESDALDVVILKETFRENMDLLSLNK